MSLTVTAVSGQITRQLNGLRAGDKVAVQRLSASGAVLTDSLWDISGCQSLGKKYERRFVSVGDSTGRIAMTDRMTQYVFQQKGDTLLYNGFKNPVFDMDYTEGVVAAVFPSSESQQLESDLNGFGRYSEMYHHTHDGKSTTQAQSLAKLILLDGDTLTDITVIKRTEIYESTFYLLSHPDSVAKLEKLKTESCYLFAPGYRYPVAQSMLVSDAKTGRQLDFQLSYSPLAELAQEDDPDNDEILAQQAANKNSWPDSAAGLSDESAAADSPIDYTFSHSQADKTVSVSITSTAPVELQLILASVAGITYRVDDFTVTPDAPLDITIDYSSLPVQAAYVLRINTSTSVSTEIFTR